MRRSFLALLVLLVSARAFALADEQQRIVIDRVNAYRAAAGLAPVSLDEEMSRGCMEHAKYMRLNFGTAAMVGLEAHKQHPELPGATEAGAACGRAADLYPGATAMAFAVDGWMATLYHRRPILSPGLKQIGVGYAAMPDGSFMLALMFGHEISPGSTGEDQPVMYPADQQKDVPYTYGPEVPNPVPAGTTGGFPITLQFAPFAPVKDVKATMEDAQGHPVPFYLSDPEHPATDFGQYGVVCVIPREPLLPGAQYTVTVEASLNGSVVHRRTSFRTLGVRSVDGADDDALGEVIGVSSLVRGTVIRAGTFASGQVYLLLGKRSLKRYASVMVAIPATVWSEAGGGDPMEFTARRIEVETTPRLVSNEKTVQLSVFAARQIRWLPLASLPIVSATDEDALTAHVGEPCRVMGKVRYGGFLSDGTVFLQIGNTGGGHYRAVSLMIPQTVWMTLGGGTPEAWKGRTVEVDTVPEIVNDVYLNLAVVAADKLHAATVSDPARR